MLCVLARTAYAPSRVNPEVGVDRPACKTDRMTTHTSKQFCRAQKCENSLLIGVELVYLLFCFLSWYAKAEEETGATPAPEVPVTAEPTEPATPEPTVDWTFAPADPWTEAPGVCVCMCHDVGL